MQSTRACKRSGRQAISVMVGSLSALLSGVGAYKGVACVTNPAAALIAGAFAALLVCAGWCDAMLRLERRRPNHARRLRTWKQSRSHSLER